MAAFQKYLFVSSETSRLSREEFRLDRVAWEDLAQVENICDYDRVVINFTALAKHKHVKCFEESEITNVFDPTSWLHIVSAGGGIILVGDSDFTVQTINTPLEARRAAIAKRIRDDVKRAEPVFTTSSPFHKPEKDSSFRHSQPWNSVLNIVKDSRPLDYRRVNQVDRPNFKAIYKYLDNVSDWKYSVTKCIPADPWASELKSRAIEIRVDALGITTYSSCLAVRYSFCGACDGRGFLTLLPPLGEDAEAEDMFILREFFGIATNLPEPRWVQKLTVPEQPAIEAEIEAKREILCRVQTEISSGEDRLLACKRWYRLLYDDGQSLEAIVKEAFELLGASITKTSKEKDDYRVKVSGFPEGVMEVKGTHNPKFNIGAVRQLAGWMDEANAREGIDVKGIFVGNATRNDEPQTRNKLFEKNNEDYAVIKGIVIIRAMDLFCLMILQRLTLMDLTAFWKEFYGCKGAFDATKYWRMLPQEYQLSAANSQQEIRATTNTA